MGENIERILDSVVDLINAWIEIEYYHQLQKK